MIVFNSKSACYISRMLNSQNTHLHSEVFFYDGLQSHRVIDITQINQVIENKGGFQSILTGFSVYLDDGYKLELDVINSTSKLITNDNNQNLLYS